MSQMSNTSQSVYSVCVFYDGVYMMTSNCYETKNNANEFMQFCSTMDPSKLQFQMYSHKSTGTPTTMTQSDPAFDLSSMTLERFGRGYLLRPQEDYEFYGEKYFLNGWWMPKHFAWFFRSEYFDELIFLGAEYISDYEQVAEAEVEVDPEDEDYVEDEYDEDDYEEELEFDSGDEEHVDYGDIIHGLTLERYGKGYMLYPDSKRHSQYGEKYLGNGWWNRRASGWFFREMFLQELLDAGVHYVSDSDSDMDTLPETTFTSNNVTKTAKSNRKVAFNKSPSPSNNATQEHGSWSTYGKGWLLTPIRSHAKYGHKSYRGGWWMAKNKAWFFKKHVAESL